MGIFTLLMVASMIVYYDQGESATFGVIFILVLICIYILPLFLNLRTVKFGDFLKGIIYIVFMTPTYINIMSIYAVANIHDVSWGSRPVGTQTNTNSNREKRMSESYQNYRSKFLIMWILLNNLAGFVVVVLSRSDSKFYLMMIGAVLMTLVGIKFLFSIMYIFSNSCSMRLMRRYYQRKNREGHINLSNYTLPIFIYMIAKKSII